MIYNKTKTNTEKGTDRHNDATIIYFFHKITNRIDLHFTIPQEERFIGLGVVRHVQCPLNKTQLACPIGASW